MTGSDQNVRTGPEKACVQDFTPDSLYYECQGAWNSDASSPETGETYIKWTLPQEKAR